MVEDVFEELGASALGSRLRRLSDRLTADVHALYRREQAEFEPRWYPLFRMLSQRGPMSVSEAARALGTTHASVSQIARSMVAAEVAVSARDPVDSRRRALTLSSRGRDLQRRLEPLWEDLQAAAQEVTQAAEHDLLPLLAAAERALEQRSLDRRVERIARERRRRTVSIVDARPELLEAFPRLNLEWLEAMFELEPPDRALLEDPQRTIVDAGGTIMFALERDTPVGTCALLPHEDGFELAKMAVTESSRGLGIGRALAEAAIERARASGAQQLHLVTSTRLAAAVSLYRSLGFVALPGPPDTAYRRCDLAMVLELHSDGASESLR